MARRSLALASVVILWAAGCVSDNEAVEPGTGGRLVVTKPNQGGAGQGAGQGGAGTGGAGEAGSGQGGAGAGDAGQAGGGQAGEGGAAGGEGGASGASGEAGQAGEGGGGQGGAGQGGAGSGGAGAAGKGGAGAGQAGAGGGASGQGGAGQAGEGGGGQAGSGGGGAGGGCTDSGTPLDVTVESFNVALAGNFIPFEKERRQPVLDALAAMDADIVCLQEVWEQSDKDLIKDAVKAKFPHVLSFKHDLSTPLDIDTDLNGAKPTFPTDPPCADAAVLPKFTAAVDCLKANCSSDPGLGEDAETKSSACATNSCGLKALSLKAASPACYGCLLPQMPTETFASMRTECTTNPKAGLAFKGQSGVMLLSKHPIEEGASVVLPGTWNRRAMLRSRVALPNGTKLGVYCHHMTPIFKGSLYPYTGLFGAGPDSNGWANEQLLHAKKLVEDAQANACGPTVVLGDLNASRAYPDASPPIGPEGVATLDELDKFFTPGVAAGYTPACTYCKNNMNVDDADTGGDQWIDHIYLLNIAASQVKSTTRTFLTPTVDAKDAGGASIKVELSDHYGFRSVISLGK